MAPKSDFIELTLRNPLHSTPKAENMDGEVVPAIVDDNSLLSSSIEKDFAKPEDDKETGAPQHIPTPPNEEDGYTLEAFGDISLSNIDFVPLPPSTLSPQKIRQEKNSSSVRLPGSTHKVRPLSLSNAHVAAADLSFDTMVTQLKRSREAENMNASPSRPAPGKPPASAIGILSTQPKHLIDTQNCGSEVAISLARSHDVVENSAQITRRPVGTTLDCAAGRDENGAPAPIVIPRPKKGPLRGSAQLPKRPPKPRWDADNARHSTGCEGEPFRLGMGSRFKLT
ncbi:hypothetical protein BDZ97DRAFT_1819439 [Flammula alnicola]|nr:hypothetical protein BDZ97DRAFT_1819439 [Flammula alnicola]